ncbi:MAG: hypothetical protein COA79_19045 [Planctomycetota bacterium]|nr:MAG: hypothetical protein COA79_19045 [Planctomycetota bacterium]
MIVEYLNYKVPVDEQTNFILDWTNSLEIVQSSIHCQSTEFEQAIEEPENFVIRIVWDSVEGHVNGFKKSESYEKAFEFIKQYSKFINPEIYHYKSVICN